ncbi:hypothetical protein ACQEU3_38785 [Spirillospora sp. CA-253888]
MGGTQRGTFTYRDATAGCVMPQHTPTFTPLSSLRFVAPNIRTLQSRAPKSLHRNTTLTAADQRAVC